jgi:hypothetical protein
MTSQKYICLKRINGYYDGDMSKAFAEGYRFLCFDPQGDVLMELDTAPDARQPAYSGSFTVAQEQIVKLENYVNAVSKRNEALEKRVADADQWAELATARIEELVAEIDALTHPAQPSALRVGDPTAIGLRLFKTDGLQRGTIESVERSVTTGDLIWLVLDDDQTDTNTRRTFAVYPDDRWSFSAYAPTPAPEPTTDVHPQASDVGRSIRFTPYGSVFEFDARITGIQKEQWTTNWRGKVLVDPARDTWRFLDTPQPASDEAVTS